MADWPLDRRRNWLDCVNRPQAEAEIAALRRCVQRGTPYGSALWIKRSAARLGLRSTLRARGRPRRKKET